MFADIINNIMLHVFVFTGPYLVMEYLSLGNMKDYLIGSRCSTDTICHTDCYANMPCNSRTPSWAQLVQFAAQVAHGMGYISSQEVRYFLSGF